MIWRATWLDWLEAAGDVALIYMWCRLAFAALSALMGWT